MTTLVNDTITVSFPVQCQLLRDLLCTAVESGGCNYWAAFSNATRTEGLDYLRVRVTEHESHSEGPRFNRYVEAEDLARGLTRLAEAASRDAASFPSAAKHLADALSNHDATTADVVLQMTMFGELVYG